MLNDKDIEKIARKIIDILKDEGYIFPAYMNPLSINYESPDPLNKPFHRTKSQILYS